MLTSLCQEIAFRETQIDLLSNLIGADEEDDPWPCIYIYGHTATGKSLVVRSVLEALKVKTVIINCVEVYYNPRLLYDQILNSVSGYVPTLDNKRYKICHNMNDFIRTLNSIIGESRQKLCLVFDKAERLREMDGNLLPALLKLQELTRKKISTILISELAWEKFKFGTGLVDPLIIHFNEYSKDEMIQILLTSLHGDYPAEFKLNYIRLALSVVFQACCNLSELSHIVNSNFENYIEPVTKGEATLSDVKKLWRSVEPHLIKSLQTVYFRYSSKSPENEVNGEAKPLNKLSIASNDIPSNMCYKNVLIELPFYSKYLLIAAYLASYNPSRTDKRFFVKGRDKLMKQSRFIQKHARATNQLLGPKPFPLDRLLAIFYSIVEERVAPTAGIFSQISSLVTLRLLTAIGGDGNLDVPKYKCAVSLDMIRCIARTVDFDVIRYLYDFI